uniref:Prothymosin alpha n=1 Tax=Ursus americanus TaxID=9643 RepID=A0A452R7S7_URSAM
MGQFCSTNVFSPFVVVAVVLKDFFRGSLLAFSNLEKYEKEVVLEAENGRDAPANGNVNEESGEQEANNKVDEEEEEGREEEEGEGYGEEEAGDEEEETEAGGAQGQLKMMRKDDDVAAKMQKTHEDG